MNRPFHPASAIPVAAEDSSPATATNRSVAFFERQFRQQIADLDFRLNPFEVDVLPCLSGRVLDFGCVRAASR